MLEQVYGERFATRYGFLRPYVKQVIYRFLDCGIPKMIRRYFLYGRKLLSDLSRCGWGSLEAFFQETGPEDNAVPGAVIACRPSAIFLDSIPISISCVRTAVFMEMVPPGRDSM